jgi:two-component system nitrate/nitrite response regulator NarL
VASRSSATTSLAAGACGYVLKGVGGDELARVIHTVYDGGAYVSPELAARMLVDARDRRGDGIEGVFSDLTVREEQILKQVAQGQSNKEIVRALELSEKTVKHYMTNILQKLQVRNRVEAAIKAREHYSGD